MKTIVTIFLITVLIACASIKPSVYFGEMATKPILKINGNVLTVKTSNSTKNSAQSIYKINLIVDEAEKTVYISANQAVGKPNQDKFIFDLRKNNIEQPDAYTFYWRDPDLKKTILDIIWGK